MFHSSNTLPDGQKEGVLAKADLLLNAYAKSGCAGVGIGDRDLGALGVEKFKELATKAKFPILNANLVYSKNNKAVFTPNILLERAGLKIGVFGLLTPGANLAESDTYTLLAPVDVARAQVAELQDGGADVIIMLAHLDRRDAGAVTKEVPGIDLVLGGQAMGNSNFLESLSDAWYVEPGQKGKHLAIVTLNMTEGGKKPFVVREAARKLKQEIIAVEGRIERYVKLANGPSKPGTRTANKERFTGVIASLVRQHQELATKAASVAKAEPNAPFLSLEMVAMNKKLRDDGEVAGWITEYNSKYGKASGHGGVPHPARPITKATRPSRVINHQAIRATGGKPVTADPAKKEGGSASAPKSTTVKKVVRPK
jgi:hypothetical protein